MLPHIVCIRWPTRLGPIWEVLLFSHHPCWRIWPSCSWSRVLNWILLRKKVRSRKRQSQSWKCKRRFGGPVKISNLPFALSLLLWLFCGEESVARAELSASVKGIFTTNGSQSLSVGMRAILRLWKLRFYIEALLRRQLLLYLVMNH